MNSTIVPFLPAPTANFQFQATFDGAPYNVVCTFNAAGQRYFFSIYDLAGNLVLSRPMTASPATFNINLTDGYFDTSMVFREATAQFEVPALPPVQPAPPPPLPQTPTGRLDRYVSGLVSAYGIYRLLGRDFQALIQVRRSSDDAILDIGTAADGQALDVATLLAFCAGSDGFVTTVYDQARRENAVAPTQAQQPIIVRGGVYLGDIEFDGVDDLLLASTPASSAISACGLFQFVAPLASFTRIFGNVNAGVMGHHGIAYQYQPPENKISLYNYGPTSDGAGHGYKQVLTAGPPGFTMAAYGVVALATDLPTPWIGGANAYASTLVNDTVAGDFTADPLCIGGAPGTYGRINWRSLAIWNNDQTSNMPNISKLM